MAAKDGSKRLTSVKAGAWPARADNAAARLDETFPVARAIADALKVLTALERATSHGERPGLATGQGYAEGHSVIDDTMPDLASHLRGLIEQMNDDASTIRDEYDALTTRHAEAGHG